MSDTGAVTARQLGEAFKAVVRRDMNKHELAMAVLMNIEERDDRRELVCHTHDFMDANMTMLEAWQRVSGEPGMPDLDGTPVLDLWNEAWSIAKREHFSWQLSAVDMAGAYVELVGYDPFEDSPTITVDEVRELVSGWGRELLLAEHDPKEK